MKYTERKCMSKKVISLVIIGSIFASNGVYAAETIQKDETVYVTLSQQGDVKERIVSDWLHSDANNIEIRDKSILKDIKNVKSDDKPIIENENVVWKVQGNDVFYRGTVDKELPLEVKVSYTLDGKAISPKELAGKSGEVKIKIDLKNKDSHSVKINGKDRTIYTPISTVAVVNLPLDNFKDIKTNSGKMINDGNNQVVTFIAFPGMKDSLDIKDDLLGLKDTLEITAKAEKFEMGPIVVTATPELPDVDSFKNASNINELIYGIEQLKDASGKLAEGSDKLVKGQQELTTNIIKLSGVMNQLGVGATSLNNGLLKLNDATMGLQNGANQLFDGMGRLAEGSKQLGGGIQQFGDGSLDFAKNAGAFSDGAVKVAEGTSGLVEGSKTISNGANELSKGTSQVAENMEGLTDGLNGLVDATEQLKQGQKQVIDGADQSLSGIKKLKKGKELELKAVDALIVGIDGLHGLVSLLGKIPGTGEVAEKLKAGLENEKQGLMQLKSSGDELLTGLTGLEDGIAKIKAGSENINSGMNKLQEGQKKAASSAGELTKATKQVAGKMGEISKGAEGLANGAEQLKPASANLKEGSQGLYGGAEKLGEAAKSINGGANTFVENTEKLQGGAKGVAEGVVKLQKEGIVPLMVGSQKLSYGVNEVAKNSVKLTEGANKLNDGTKELSANMKKFDEEGIKKLSGEVSNKTGNVKEIIDAKDELIKLSDNYGTFTGIGTNMEGKVKFIMKTDEIKVATPEKNETKVEAKVDTKEHKKGFVAWIKGLFS